MDSNHRSEDATDLQGGVRGGGEADAPEQNAAAPAPDTVQACNL